MTPLINRRRRAMRRDGYSIAAVLLLMATIAVMLASVRTLPVAQLGPGEVVNVFAAMFGGAIVGGMIGMSHERRAQGLIVGINIGLLAGLTSGGILFAPDQRLSIPLIGSIAILLFAALVRATSGPAGSGDPAGGDAEAAAPLAWLKQMTSGQKLSLLLGALLAIFVVLEGVKLIRWEVYLNPSEMIARLVMLCVLSLITLLLIRLAVRKPRGDRLRATPIEVSPPPRSETLSRQEPGER